MIFSNNRTLASANVETNIYLEGAPYNISLLTNFENQLGVKFNAVMWYEDFNENLDTSVANRIHNSGHLPELTWQPQVNGAGISYSSAANGSMDSYLTTFAKSAAGLGYPIRISLAPEMNLSEIPWAIGNNGNNASNFIAFWRHTVDIFNANGAGNVSWIWSPNTRSFEGDPTYASFYPGDSYVSYMGLDGYNWGTTQSWSRWETFDQVFKASYNELTTVSGKNILIMETACAESGGNKASWITNMFSVIRSSYPKLVGFTWFNINKETDWRIESSQVSKDAFVKGANTTVSTNTSNNTNTNTSTNTGGSSSSTPTNTPTSGATPTIVATATTSQSSGGALGGTITGSGGVVSNSYQNGRNNYNTLKNFFSKRANKLAFSLSLFSGASILWLKKKDPKKTLAKKYTQTPRHFDSLRKRG